jgi:hypothetical protein
MAALKRRNPAATGFRIAHLRSSDGKITPAWLSGQSRVYADCILEVDYSVEPPVVHIAEPPRGVTRAEMVARLLNAGFMPTVGPVLDGSA